MKRAVIYGAGGAGSKIFEIEKVVDDYEKELGVKLHKLPIGDDISIAIVKGE